MERTKAENKKLLKDLTAQLKELQTKLAHALKLEGKDANIEVKITKNYARYRKIVTKRREVPDVPAGQFYLTLEITAKQGTVFIPLSIASGRKTAGFMYQIEGTAEGTIDTASVEVKGDGVTQVTVGTLLFAKIPTGKTARFTLELMIRGALKKKYKIVITRLNYKLALTETRYQQYLKELHSDDLTFPDRV